MEEKIEKNIFEMMETQTFPSENKKKEVLSEIEFIQNSSKIIDLFIGNYFKTIVEVVS